jgi:hypothetical protein
MTTVTIKITDAQDELQMEGSMDNPNAINEPPTAALIVGSYLAANAERVAKDAMAWFKAINDSPEQPQAQSRIVLPPDVEGAPV